MNWTELNALYRLNENGSVMLNQTLANSFVFGYLAESLQVIEISTKTVTALEGFNDVFNRLYAELFERCNNFLVKRELLRPQTRFEISDIEILIKIDEGMASGELVELRNQIISADESLRGVSLMFFKNEKYLLNKPSLIYALKEILQVEHFSIEKDQQYIYKLECQFPKVIVLCENLDFLTKPVKPRRYGVELWYAGGKNINKLEFADTRGLPIYYSCDWDFDGLQIYQWVKRTFPQIVLLKPNGSPKGLSETEHASLWKSGKSPELLSGLNPGDFVSSDLDLIKQLITNDQWIVEESNNLISMLQSAGVLCQD